MALLSDEVRFVLVKNVLLYHLPLLVYAVAVLSVSSVPNLRPPEVGLPGVDKLAHFAEYAVLAFLTFRSFSRLGSDRPVGMTALWTLMFLVVFAFADETLQSFVPGRHSDVFDYLTDLLAGLVVVSVIVFRGVHGRRL